jgi:hypothetical protein
MTASRDVPSTSGNSAGSPKADLSLTRLHPMRAVT